MLSRTNLHRAEFANDTGGGGRGEGDLLKMTKG